MPEILRCQKRYLAREYSSYAPTTPNSALDIYRSVLGHLPQSVLLQLGLGQQPLEAAVLLPQLL